MAGICSPSRGDRRLFGTGAALAGILLLAGCGTTGAGESGSSASSSPTRTTGPLDEFFGSQLDQPSEEEMAAKERQVQEAIVACMAAEGFEYRPYVQPPPDADFFTDMETRAFAEKYGYGIANSPFAEQAFDPTADPNQAIVEAMTPAERDAYYAALNGPPMPADGATGDGSTGDGADMVPPEDMGCWGDAVEQVYGVGPASGEFDDLFERLGKLHEQADDDPAVMQALQRWAICMSDAGHPGYSDAEAPREEIGRRSQEYYQSAYPEPTGPVEPTGAATDVTESWTPPPPDDPALVALQRDEIDLAVTDFDCREQSGYQRALTGARTHLEEQFVRDNRAELERFRDSVDNGGG